MADVKSKPTEPEKSHDPIPLFESWLDDAVRKKIALPESLALATCSAGGLPSVRIVLYKGMVRGGFSFVTNYESRKGRELADNPKASMAFHWAVLERQVRVTGTVEKLTDEESDSYWTTRARESQIGAWASAQSRPTSREALDRKFEEIERKFEGKPIPRPAFWGGYALFPETVEFWEGRPNRMHDRIVFTRDGSRGWTKTRLAP